MKTMTINQETINIMLTPDEIDAYINSVNAN